MYLIYFFFIFSGIVSSIFSWKGFMVCTRLSYTFYLTQFPVFFYNVGSNRTALEYSFELIVSLLRISLHEDLHIYDKYMGAKYLRDKGDEIMYKNVHNLGETLKFSSFH